ncbi:T9SS type A sorting domain-containing protein [Neolewinella lacunae]|uniref:T9SS type A sorting domain-containing protein n=1 Tax=Neolewinella lacunae TaxID=1517758 RepID=A0A923T7V4_9BACT|nr:dockerin type I domain-containing protein [Neolewinella lacunae]MBC6994930.1 T9SS type A sorting domain-containing protein [Neolewinella lacunae]MDN3633491.1 T9SS type A sorting domain-containing protein [Neolewinella lacunae]
MKNTSPFHPFTLSPFHPFTLSPFKLILFLALLLSPFLGNGPILAQTNTVSGSIINAPGSSSVAIPSRQVRFEFISTDPEFPSTFINTNSTTSNTYSLSYTGGPFFISDEARVFVNLATTPNPVVDVSCITTSDIIAINNYINGTQSFTSAQKVSADVDIDGYITLTDREMIRDVILGLEDRYTNSISVAGVSYTNRGVVFPTTAELSSLGDPISFSSNYFFDPIPTGSNPNKNFNSIILGDVNGTCSSYSSFSGENPSSSSSTGKHHNLYLSNASRQIVAGQTFDVTIGTKDFADLSLLSFRLKFQDGVRLIGVTTHENSPKDRNFRIGDHGEQLTVLAFLGSTNKLAHQAKTPIGQKEDFMTMRLQADRKIFDLAQFLSLDNASFENLVTKDDEVGNPYALSLEIIKNDLDVSTIISPNPFRENLTVNLPSPNFKLAKLLDLNGREYAQKSISEGQQVLIFNEGELNTLPVGTYILQLFSKSGEISSLKLVRN